MRELTFKQALTEALIQEMKNDKSVYVMGEDVGIYGGGCGVCKGLIDEFSHDRVIDTPISENGFTGMAIGSAIVGMRPVVEFMFSDFMALGFDSIVNTGAKLRYTYGGVHKVPVVLRGASGSGTGASAQHSQSPETWFMGIDGVKIVIPSNPYDAKGLLISSIRDDNIVIFLEPKTLYDTVGNVPQEEYCVPLGKANVIKKGTDISIITYGRMVNTAVEIANEINDISVEVLDLRTISPLDEESIINTAKKTGRVILLSEASKTGSPCSEISALISESEAFMMLKAPIKRLCGADVPVPHSPNLEKDYIPSKSKIIDMIYNQIRQ